MARVAVHGGMSASQWESIVVLLHLLDRDLPSANGVALFAVRAQLTPMYIGVAVLASLADIAEHWLDVTLRATDGRVHTPKRISCLVVIEFRNGADRFPCVRGVTVLARHSQIPVRTARCRGDLRANIP